MHRVNKDFPQARMLNQATSVYMKDIDDYTKSTLYTDRLRTLSAN